MFISGFLSQVTSLVLLEDGRLATAEERRIKIWNPNSGDQEGEIVGNRTQITALASIKEDVLASGTRAGIVKIWHISEGDAVKTITAHTSGVTSLAALDEHRLASAAEDGWIKVWDIESGRELIRFSENFGHVISLVRIPDGSLCSVCLNDKFIRIWNTDSGHLVKTIDAGEIVYSVAAFKDNALVAGLDKGKIKVWKKHRESSEKLYTAEADQIIWLYVEGPIRSILVLSNGFVATGSSKGKVRVYNLAKPERSIRVFLGHINSVTYLLPLKDQTLFISSGSDDGKINIWNVNTDKIVRTFGTSDLAAEVPHSFTEFIYKEQKRIETTLNTNVKTFEVELPKLETRTAEPSPSNSF